MIGTVIGNYRIERELGEGGMSHVYVGRTIARNEILPADYTVVLKVMSEELAGEVTARKRFVKEAHILEKLRHRYITRFYEFINNADHAVLVMELVEGTPVDVLLTERGALPIADAISTTQCLLEALVYRAMQPRMEQRYESARQFFEALEQYNLRPGYTPTMRPIPAATPPPGSSQQWQLVHVKAEANEKHALNGDSIMVGRDRTCSVVLAHPAVSRRHARITMAGGSLTLEDLKSANGTYVNNTRVDKAVLKPGDVVRFGADPACSYVLRSQ